MDGGAWWVAVHGVAKSLSDFTFTFHFHALEKEMATHSSVLAWIIPGLRAGTEDEWELSQQGAGKEARSMGLEQVGRIVGRFGPATRTWYH